MLISNAPSASRAVARSAFLFALAGLVFVPSAQAQKITAPGFTVELVGQPPEIEHPSVVTCDADGNLYVGEDPMDMRGPTTKEFDRVLLLRWDAQTGKPIRTVFCENLSAVFGLIWHEGALYVLHAPHYTRFRDTDGDGVADERTELADGFGPAAGVFGFNDHIVTGARLGLDGLVYISVGDKGIQKATGADGSSITLEGGGAARMRLDGTQLEVVSSGTRNHLDVAMDSLDNIFTYDNTDDGLGWWTRFTHHIPTGYYGYPYDYHPHPDRHLPRISEHGGGSPVGAASYCEAAWPMAFRENSFHCEWGKGKVQRFALAKSGATFTAEIDDFMVKDGKEEFRPLDLCFSPDGKHMYVADWNFGGWCKPEVCGRLYRVTYTGGDVPPEPPRASDSSPLAAQLVALGHPARSERTRAQYAIARLGAVAIPDVAVLLESPATPKMAKAHAIWTLNQFIDRVQGYDPSAVWIATLGDADADVRAQAARALGLRRMKSAVEPLSHALADADPTVRMWAAIGLGRIGSAAAAPALFAALGEQDAFARFAIVQALRAIDDWSLAEEALASSNAAVRGAALLALTGVYDETATRALAATAAGAPDSATRAAAIAAIAEAHHKAEPYVKGWWGTRPAASKPSRPKKIDWAGTSLVLATLQGALRSSDPAVRAAAMEVYKDIPDPGAEAILQEMAADPANSEAVRVAAIEWFGELPSTSQGTKKLLKRLIADSAQPPAIKVAALRSIAKPKNKSAADVVEQALSDPAPGVRIAALEALQTMIGAAAGPQTAQALADADSEVRRTAIRLVGEMEYREALPALVARASDPETRDESLAAAARMPDRRALGLYLDALQSKNSTLRDGARAALATIKNEIGDEIIERNRRNELPGTLRAELQSVFHSPTPIKKWIVLDSWDKSQSRPTMDFSEAPNRAEPFLAGGKKLQWREMTGKDPNGRISLASLRPNSNAWTIAYAAVESSEAQDTTYAIGSDDQVTLWINGEQIYDFQNNRGWSANQDRGPARLRQGTNHIYLQIGNDGGPWDFSLAIGGRDPKFAFLFDNVPAKLDASLFRDFALKKPGDPVHGRILFNDAKGVGCVKCHAVGGQGGKVGPDLIGVGAKYPREELIRSVLEPSNRVVDGYRATTIVTDAGKVLSGIVRVDSPEAVELLDAAGKTTRIPAGEIDERQESNLSLMPNGLKDGLTLEDFADVIAYMESLKQSDAKK